MAYGENVRKVWKVRKDKVGFFLFFRIGGSLWAILCENASNLDTWFVLNSKIV